MFKEVPIPLGDLLAKNPPEMQCLGFNVVDIGVDFRKGQCQFSAYYKHVDNPDEEICAEFKEELKKSP